MNLPRVSGCKYEAARDCPVGQCVVGVIERQGKVLASSVADAHQPLHAGYADDKGGNRYQMQVFGRGTNLHPPWESRLIESWPGGTAALLAELKVTPNKATGAAPAQWVEESCRIVAADGFYSAGHKIDSYYAKSAAPALKGRPSSAGRRLAALFNSALVAR